MVVGEPMVGLTVADLGLMDVVIAQRSRRHLRVHAPRGAAAEARVHYDVAEWPDRSPTIVRERPLREVW
jgi:hypothetical protein